MVELSRYVVANDFLHEFNTTSNNYTKFCDVRAMRANSTAPAPTADVLANAMRLYRAMRNETATGELGYEGQEEGQEDDKGREEVAG